MIVTFSHYVNYRIGKPDGYIETLKVIQKPHQVSNKVKTQRCGRMVICSWLIGIPILYKASHSRLYMGKRALARFLGSAFIHLEVIWERNLRNTVPITFIKKHKCSYMQ